MESVILVRATLTTDRNRDSLRSCGGDQKTNGSHAGWGLIFPPPRPRFRLIIFLNQCSRKPLLMGGNWPKDDSGLRSIGFSRLLSQLNRAVPLEELGPE